MVERLCSTLCNNAKVYYPTPDTFVLYCTANGFYKEVKRIWFAHSNPEITIMNSFCISPREKSLKNKPDCWMSDDDWKIITDRLYWPSEPFGGIDPFAIGDDDNITDI